MAKHREKQKLLPCNVTVTQGNATDIERDKERDKDIERDKKNNSADAPIEPPQNPPDEDAPKKKKFTPPTIDEIREYCKERENNIDPERFFDYQVARGWVLSNGKKMQDWKATIRTWEKPKEEKASRFDKLKKNAAYFAAKEASNDGNGNQ